MSDHGQDKRSSPVDGNLYFFGRFTLDARKRTLSRDGSLVSLTPKAFDVLLFLVQHPNRLVTKEELLNAVWGDTFVEEGNLAQYISHVRKALRDNSEDTRLIVTIARKGYQFVGDVASTAVAGPLEQSAAQVSVSERSPIDPSPSSGVKRLRRRGIALLSAKFLWVLLAGLLLAAVALSYGGYRAYRHRITLSPTDTIVLADVDNRTNDPVFDGALNIALRFGLEQTPYLDLLGLDKTYATIGQMKLAPNTKITPEVALQICRKTNSKVVIADSIADAGNGYRLEIRALDCGTGAVLAEEVTNIGARSQVVHELGATAVRLRRRLGEPADSLDRFNQPLEKATSASLETLQAGAEGTKLLLAGDLQAALAQYQRGVELDPEHALGHQAIGVVHDALHHYELSAASFTRAYQLRDRMTEKDRLNIEYTYYSGVTGELDKAYSVLLSSLERFPRDVFFRSNMVSTLLKLGEVQRAADLADETARTKPSPLYFSWAIADNIIASRFKAARSWLDQAEALKFDSPGLRRLRLELAIIEGDRDALDRIFDTPTAGPEQVVILRERSIFEAQQGHFDSAERLQLTASNLSADQEDISRGLVYSALRAAEAGRSVPARIAQDQALQNKLERNTRMILALSLARSGRTNEAERLADEVGREAPLDSTVQRYLVPTVRAAVKLQQHDPNAAIDLLRETLPYDFAYTRSFDFLYPAYLRGLAYLDLGDGRSAAAEFQKLIDNPGLCWRHITGPLARLQLGRAKKLMGDNVAARESYEAFLGLWKDADPDLPAYRQAKAEYSELQKLK
jgi:DNA-binding winged helix-turn-helix (wHTH) protein